MQHRTSRRHLLIVLVSVLAILASACSSGANDKARPEAAAGESNNSSSVRIPVYVYNGTDQTVTLNVGTDNSRTGCRTNTWIYKGQNMQTGDYAFHWGGRLDPIGPGGRINDLFIDASSCGPRSSPTASDAFAIGIEGAAWFKFDVKFARANPQSNSDEFDYLAWRGGYTGGGDTHGLVQYKASNNAILGNGKRGINDNFNYHEGQQVYFSYCPQINGKTKGEWYPTELPDSCRKP